MMKEFPHQVENLISSLRALPENSSKARNKGTKAMGSVLETCIERYHIGRRTPEESVLENWARIVGPAFSNRCRPERIDPSGALIVQVANATVRRELIFMEDRILTALGSINGCGHIHRVVLKAGQ